MGLGASNKVEFIFYWWFQRFCCNGACGI